MTWNLNRLVQILLVATHVTAQLQDVVPPDWQPWLILAQGATQLVLGRVAAHRNPNGTPATVPYREGL